MGTEQERLESALKAIIQLVNSRDEELALDCEKILDEHSVT